MLAKLPDWSQNCRTVWKLKSAIIFSRSIHSLQWAHLQVVVQILGCRELSFADVAAVHGRLDRLHLLLLVNVDTMVPQLGCLSEGLCSKNNVSMKFN